MYTKALRRQVLNQYACLKGLLARNTQIYLNISLAYLRFQYPHEYEKPCMVNARSGLLGVNSVCDLDEVPQVRI